MNKFHKKGKDIYMMVNQSSAISKWRPVNASSSFNFNYQEYPELEYLTSIIKYKEGDLKLTYQDKSFSPEGIVTDTSFSQIFDFRMLRGEGVNILTDPEAIILSERLAEKIFGSTDPIGQNLTLTASTRGVYTVRGVVSNSRPNSSLTFDFIVPKVKNRFMRGGGNFLLVNDGFDRLAFDSKIKSIGEYHPQFKNSITKLVPLDEVYFKNKQFNFERLFSKFGSRKNLYIIYVICFIVFIVSLLNFSNLQIIGLNSSTKKLGILQVNGAHKMSLIALNLSEFFIYSLLVFLLIIPAYYIVLPYFNSIMGVDLILSIEDILVFVSCLDFVFLVFSMIYPLVVIQKTSIIDGVKNQLSKTNNLLGQKKIVVVQFSLLVILLIASFVVSNQLDLMLTKDLGFSTKNIVHTKLFHDLPYEENREELLRKFKIQKEDYQFVKNELTSQTCVVGFSQSSSPLSNNAMPWKVDGKVFDFTTQHLMSVTPESINIFDFEMIEGRFFDRNLDKSRDNKVIINEAAVKFWDIKDISKVQILNKFWMRSKFEIIGVVKNFHNEHLSMKPGPLIMCYFEDIDNDFFIELNSSDRESGLEVIRDLYNRTNVGQDFSYSFLSDEVEKLYQNEKRLSLIYIIFTLVALFISSIGLFTVALYDTKKRVKEIGVRKVNGAKTIQIIKLLNSDFLKLVLIAIIIACPVAWYAMSQWLENFAYKTELSWWIFALAGLIAMGIALLTVSFQSWRAASRNPVESLRYE
jgi:putative ABC transport system permease protein